MVASEIRKEHPDKLFAAYYDWPLAICVILTAATWYAVLNMLSDPTIVRNITSSYFVLASFVVGMTFLLALGPVGCFLYSQRVSVWPEYFTVWKLMRRTQTFQFTDISRAVIYADRTGIGARLVLSDGRKIVVMPTARNLNLLREFLQQRLPPDRIERDW